MKPRLDIKRCFASQSVCKAIKACPVNAITYAEAAFPILDKKDLKCNCEPGTCDCDGNCGDSLYSCGGTPYGRILFDLELCIGCGLCAETCCGSAIEMIA